MGNGKIWREGEDAGEVDLDVGAKMASTRTESMTSTTLGSISEEVESEDSDEASIAESLNPAPPGSISSPGTAAIPASSTPQIKKPAASSRWTSFVVDSNDDEDEDDGNSSTEADRSLDAPSVSSTTSTVMVNEDGETTLKDAEDGVDGVALPPSPPSTISDHDDHHGEEPEEDDMTSYFPGMEDAEKMVTLSGTIPLAAAAGRPSFNYKYMSRHVSLAPLRFSLVLRCM